MNGKYTRLKAALAIDLLRFDQELMEIAQLIQEASEECAEACAVRDRAKHTRDIEIASAANTLRSTPDTKGKYPSETQVGSEIALVEEVQDAKTALIEAERVSEMWRGLVDALRNKKEILRTLSDQMLAGFLSPTSIVKDARQEMNAARRPLPVRGAARDA